MTEHYFTRYFQRFYPTNVKIRKISFKFVGFIEFIEFLAPIYSVPAKLNCFVDEKMTKTEVFL